MDSKLKLNLFASNGVQLNNCINHSYFQARSNKTQLCNNDSDETMRREKKESNSTSGLM